MDPRISDMLRRLNNEFYRRCAPSFSETRQAPWEGWRACLPHLRAAADGGPGGGGLTLVDIACGNGRFEAFLAQELAGVAVRAVGIDSCDELMREARVAGAGFRHFDAMDALACGIPWREALAGLPGASRDAPSAPFDAAVCFGFLHHIPSAVLRERALHELLDLVRPGGIAIVSLWRFLEDERLSCKAERSHAEALAALAPAVRAEHGIDLAAELEEGDRFLGWKDAPGLWRYCHSFDDGETDRLAATVADTADAVARFRSDGKSGRLNAYLIFRKH